MRLAIKKEMFAGRAWRPTRVVKVSVDAGGLRIGGCRTAVFFLPPQFRDGGAALMPKDQVESVIVEALCAEWLLILESQQTLDGRIANKKLKRAVGYPVDELYDAMSSFLKEEK